MSYDPIDDEFCDFEWAGHACNGRPGHSGDHVCAGCGVHEPADVSPEETR